MTQAFGISSDDISAVLSRNSLKVTNTNGVSFDAMGEILLPSIDDAAVEKAALYYDDLDDQTGAAHREIHRQLFEMGVISIPPEGSNESQPTPETARARLIDELANEASSQDPLDLVAAFKTGFPGLESMPNAKLGELAVSTGIARHLHDSLKLLGLPTIRYVHGDWFHLFGPGRKETHTKICYDLEQECLIAAQIKDGPGADDFVMADRHHLADLEESIKIANSDALLNPADYSLMEDTEPPRWALDTDHSFHQYRPRG